MPQWFRFYNEAIDDRKLKRVARDADQPLALVIGCWSIIMALANNDYERGYLLLGSDSPFSRDDLLDEIGQGLNGEIASRILFEFESIGLIAMELDTQIYYLPAFSKRQYESDTSTPRVRAFRERQRNVDETVDETEHETFQKRFRNGPETESDPEAEQTETETNKPADAGPPPNSTDFSTFQDWQTYIKAETNRPAALQTMFAHLYPGHDPPSYGYIGRVAKQIGGAGRLADLLWKHSTRPPTGDVLAYIQATAKGKDNGANRTDHRTDRARPVDPETLARQRAALRAGTPASEYRPPG